MLRAALSSTVAAVLVLSTGCDTSQDDDVEPKAAQVSAGLAELYAGSDPAPAVRAEAGCFADELLARRTLAELVEVGVVGDDGVVLDVPPVLDRPTAEAWVDAQAACTDAVEVSTRAAAARAAAAGDRLDAAAYRSCLERELDDEQVREALVDALTGRFGSPASVRVTDREARCRAEATDVV